VSLVVVIRRFGFGPIYTNLIGDHCDSLGCRPILQYSRVISFDRCWCGSMLGGPGLCWVVRVYLFSSTPGLFHL